jgi:hypothetical protein
MTGSEYIKDVVLAYYNRQYDTVHQIENFELKHIADDPLATEDRCIFDLLGFNNSFDTNIRVYLKPWRYSNLNEFYYSYTLKKDVRYQVTDGYLDVDYFVFDQNEVRRSCLDLMNEVIDKEILLRELDDPILLENGEAILIAVQLAV